MPLMLRFLLLKVLNAGFTILTVRLERSILALSSKPSSTIMELKYNQIITTIRVPMEPYILYSRKMVDVKRKRETRLAQPKM